MESDWSKPLRFEATDDDMLGAEVTLPSPGLYRHTAKADHGAAVTQLVFSGSDTSVAVDD
ncbi:hypothetical protein [Streptomyces sp. Tue6028]|uniref:hypothetical protein n=1 Tax=Streptomyces sp. Tue6028 TaxID=2036037 RepID=UPI003D714DA9